MKSTKIVGLAALVTLTAMAFVGVSLATAESTVLCKVDESPCEKAHNVTHVHEETLSGAKAKLLAGSTGTVECNALFLGDALSGETSVVIHGHFTYSSCALGGTTCTVKEVSTDSLLEVLQLGHESADVTGKGEVNVHCGLFINCTYNGTGLKATATGPLLSSFENGDVTLSKQTVNKVSGICPSTGELDISKMPLEPVYISEPPIKMTCLKLKERTGLYLSAGNGQTCTSDSVERVGFYELAEVSIGSKSGEMACGEVERSGFFLESGGGTECKVEDSERKGAFELGTVG